MYVRAESCLTLCDPMDCSRLGSSVPGIFQAKHWCGLPFPPSGDTPDRLSCSKFHLILMIPPNAHYIPVFAMKLMLRKVNLLRFPRAFIQQAVENRCAQNPAWLQSLSI